MAHHDDTSLLSSDISRRNPYDEYELMEKIGSGAYGAVYKAKRIQSNELVAIKIIQLVSTVDVQDILKEVKFMRDCLYPNIIAYYGSYLRHDKLWICMEYCGGGSLHDIYLVTGPLSEPQIAYVCRETLKGLQYLHSLGKIHRDIKAANILLTEHGDIKLVDFGVSAQITATIDKRTSTIGSPYWMAPEVVGDKGYNQLCDIWSCGITAIELAETKPPMIDLHPLRVLYLMTKSSFKSPTLSDKNKWSAIFNNFVKMALIKQPKKRLTAERLLKHPFVQGNISVDVIKELLENYIRLNEQLYCDWDSDEETLVSMPQRIASKMTLEPSDLSSTNGTIVSSVKNNDRSCSPATLSNGIDQNDSNIALKDLLFDSQESSSCDAFNLCSSTTKTITTTAATATITKPPSNEIEPTTIITATTITTVERSQNNTNKTESLLNQIKYPDVSDELLSLFKDIGISSCSRSANEGIKNKIWKKEAD